MIGPPGVSGRASGACPRWEGWDCDVCKRLIPPYRTPLPGRKKHKTHGRFVFSFYGCSGHRRRFVAQPSNNSPWSRIGRTVSIPSRRRQPKLPQRKAENTRQEIQARKQGDRNTKQVNTIAAATNGQAVVIHSTRKKAREIRSRSFPRASMRTARSHTTNARPDCRTK